MLTTEAFNALLKTLEDPPLHVIFILATTERHKIPETILSRCQQFEFRRMSYFEIVERLKEICQEERFSVSDQALELIARQSEGCLRDAEVTLDQLISYSNGDVSVEDVSSLLGLGSYNLFEQLVTALILRQSAEALKTLNTLSNKGADLTRLLNSLISHFLDLQRIKLHPEPKGLIDVSDSRLAELKLQADRISLQRLRLLVRLLIKTAKDIKQFGYEQVNLECGIVEMCQIPDGLQLEEAIAKLSELQAKLEQLTTGDRKQETGEEDLEDLEDLTDIRHPTPEIPEISEISEINVVWNTLLERLKHKEKRVLALIEYAKPIELKSETLLIGFSDQEVFFKEQLEKEENRRIVEAELSQILSKKIAISFLTSDKIKPKDIESEKTSTVSQQLLLQREAMNNEKVQLVLNVLGGEVVKVKE
jgi:DNA polymerase-3 subunit gamma/tau